MVGMGTNRNGTRRATLRERGAVRAWRIGAVLVVCIEALAVPRASVRSEPPGRGRAASQVGHPILLDAQNHFYNARYEAAAALTLAFHASGQEDLVSNELRTSALLFQLKALLEGRRDQHRALSTCAACPELMKQFFADVRRGQTIARAALQADPGDETALFFLGKLDLNYVWLQLGPLRRRTGWDEYWEARHALDAVLKRNPQHVRARVARAWIDYIVDTRMPWGTRWLLGGGDRKRALVDIHAAARMEADFFTHAEAEFALWDMLIRERNMTQATEVARRLVRDFPDNRELTGFLEGRDVQ